MREKPQFMPNIALWCSEWCESILLYTNLVIVTQYRLVACFISYSTCCVALSCTKFNKKDPSVTERSFFYIQVSGLFGRFSNLLGGLCRVFLGSKGEFVA